MKHNLLHNERGDLSFFTVFIILAVNMLLSFLLLFFSVQINCINIRNAAKMELNNVSARIYADTYHSQREANLDSYMADLHISSAYQDALRASFINGMEERVRLTSEDYSVENIDLQFYQHDDRIEYEATCDATFQIRMFGDLLPPITQHIVLIPTEECLENPQILPQLYSPVIGCYYENNKWIPASRISSAADTT